jgi:hypothetical protein
MMKKKKRASSDSVLTRLGEKMEASVVKSEGKCVMCG